MDSLQQQISEAAAFAGQHKKFLYVSVGKETLVIPITDALSIWMTKPDVIFHSGYRVAGTKPDLREFLSFLSDADFDQLVDTAITNNNYKTNPYYKDELSTYTEWINSAVKSNNMSAGAKLRDLMVALNPQILVARKSEPAKIGRGTYGINTGVSDVSRASRGRTSADLNKRLISLEPGKVLDVSKIKDTGAGVIKINTPTDRSSKYFHPSLPIASDNFPSFMLAISMLNGGELAYPEAVAYMRSVFGNQPGQQFAPAPSVQQIAPTQLPQPPITSNMGTFIAPPPTMMVEPTAVYAAKSKKRTPKPAAKSPSVIPAPGQYQIPAPGQYQYPSQYQNPAQYPGQYQSQIPVPGQYQSQIPVPGQYQSQIPVPGQYQSQIPVPGQYQSQIPVPGQYQSQIPVPGQYQSQIPVPGQYQSQIQVPSQYQSQIQGPSQYQYPGQYQIPVPGQYQGQYPIPVPGQIPKPAGK